ncbi:reverse transcriptase domain-containing protein [Tanacetum coccineum]
MEIKSLAIFTDSQLMDNQIKRIFEARQLTIKQYLEKVKEVLKGFDTFTIEHVRKNQNKKADALSKLASMTFEHLTKEVLVEVLAKRSINDKEVSKVEAERGESWMNPIHEYLLSGLLLEDQKEARKIRIKAQQYKDTAKIIQDRSRCQEYSTLRKVPSKDAISSGNTWSFSHWGISILGPLPTAPGNLKFLTIVVKHLTKWVEAKPVMTTNEKQAEKFIWEHVICRFGVLNAITSKDDKQSREDNEPHLEAASPISARRVDDLAWVLWVHRTLPRNSQGESPFTLSYDSKAIPPSTKSLTPISKEHNSRDKRKEGKDKEVASIEEAYYQNKLRKYHDTRSSRFRFKLGDFVLLSQGNKEGYNIWQGPHIATRVYEGELYTITDASDYSLVQSAKGTSLRKFYI